MSELDHDMNNGTHQEPVSPEPTVLSPTSNPIREREPRAGALKSSLTLELHTHYAIRLWDGRRRGHRDDNLDKKPKHRARFFRIFSMPQVIAVAGVANNDSSLDNPYADALLVKLEDALTVSSQKIQSDVDELSSILKSIPQTLSLTDVRSVSPLNIGVYSRSPLGYRCVWLLVGYDQLAMRVFQAFHYGLISRAQRDKYLDSNGYAVRQIYGLVQSYRSFSVTRSDILLRTPIGIKAIERFGEPDPDVMSGRVRSSFSSPLHEGK
ncbi:TIGR03761 family integrating conjugative element protein [Pectobacterium cacticida]|uniref:TIGR03761 family integrating conjugative element protein n=1 Tax=Pectobacterium cacticida TaxID=69221 RepID=A0ABZ2G7L1_9GAMM|nr:TIGR03761 family integrating conjugative element protein [Pectobacterium cacticida]UYX07936.1 TIGR03761 family integrating conjugative element protein [Pectobacterium cacticida]